MYKSLKKKQECKFCFNLRSLTTFYVDCLDTLKPIVILRTLT